MERGGTFASLVVNPTGSSISCYDLERAGFGVRSAEPSRSGGCNCGFHASVAMKREIKPRQCNSGGRRGGLWGLVTQFGFALLGSGEGIFLFDDCFVTGVFDAAGFDGIEFDV